MSPKEAPASGKVPQVVAGGSKATSPTETTHQGERDLETALGILGRIDALRIQILHDMGGVRELEQAAVHTLMAEFTRLQSILGEDLTRSLSALRSELETSSEALSSDLLSVLNLHSGDPAFPQVKELIQKYHQSVSMKVNLPLMELETAREDLGRFLQGCLCELSSDLKAREVVEEISQTLSSCARRVQEAIIVLGIEQPGVFNRVMLALAMDQPVEAILFPGILDGLSGRLGLKPTSVVDPPTSAREGMSRQWAAALREAVLKTEGREVNLDQVMPHVVTLGSTRTITWISECGGLMTLLQPSRPLCYQGSSAAFVSLGGQRYPKGLHLPRWKRACGVAAELLLGQMYQAPHTSAGLWRQKETNHWSRGELISTQPSLCLTQRTQLPSSYQMMTRLASLLVGLRPSLHQKLSWPGARSDPWRTGVHACLLQRSRLQKKWRRVRLLVKQFSPKGCQRRTSSSRDMKSLPQIMTGSRA